MISSPEPEHAPRASAPVAVILAGGRSRRMQGRDKGLVELCGGRLVDRVIERLRPQAARLVLSAPHDYGTGLPFVPDLPGAPEGPAGGVWSAQRWLERHCPEAECFVTAPVDGPFVPSDLAARLCAEDVSAIAGDGEHDHPTFACWRPAGLAAAWKRLEGRRHVPLKALAGACGARHVVWNDANAFLNINAPEDLERAIRLLRAGGKSPQAAP